MPEDYSFGLDRITNGDRLTLLDAGAFSGGFVTNPAFENDTFRYILNVKRTHLASASLRACQRVIQRWPTVGTTELVMDEINDYKLSFRDKLYRPLERTCFETLKQVMAYFRLHGRVMQRKDELLPLEETVLHIFSEKHPDFKPLSRTDANLIATAVYAARIMPSSIVTSDRGICLALQEMHARDVAGKTSNGRDVRVYMREWNDSYKVCFDTRNPKLMQHAWSCARN